MQSKKRKLEEITPKYQISVEDLDKQQ